MSTYCFRSSEPMCRGLSFGIMFHNIQGPAVFPHISDWVLICFYSVTSWARQCPWRFMSSEVLCRVDWYIPTFRNSLRAAHLNCSPSVTDCTAVKMNMWPKSNESLSFLHYRVYVRYLFNCWARSGEVSWGTDLQTGRSRVRFPNVSMEFFIHIILLAALCP